MLVEHYFHDSHGTYGYRRIQAMLARAGHHCDPHTVRAIMREQGLVAAQPPHSRGARGRARRSPPMPPVG